MTFVGVVVGAAIGTLLRAVARELGDAGRRPIGTTAVNVIGSFALGVLVGAGWPDGVVTAIGVGFLGSLTTFSTVMVSVATSRRTIGTTRLVVGIGLPMTAAYLGLLIGA